MASTSVAAASSSSTKNTLQVNLVGYSIDYRPTEKGLETPQIYPGIDVTIRNKSALRLYGEIALPAQHIPKSCKLVKQRAKLIRLSRHYFSRDL